MTAITTEDRHAVRAARLWDPKLKWETRDDGTTLIWREDALDPYPDRLTDMIDHWAEARPDQCWMAQRDGAEWRRISYGELAGAVRRIGQWLLSRGLSTERPHARAA